MKNTLALIGARGYVGQELLQCLLQHDKLQLVLARSGSQAGQALGSVVPGWPDDQTFVDLKHNEVADTEADVWVLAVPNGHSKAWVDAIEQSQPEALILDLGADYRFDEHWVYGLTEFNRQALRTARRISNPGCYATGAQFGLMPIREALAAPPVIFGISGYSGAGRMPSPRNDPKRLADNLIPYALGGHLHEHEISAHLGRIVRFYPHVAPFFRGISLTIATRLTEPHSNQSLYERFQSAYADEPLVHVGTDIPEIRDLHPASGLRIGGFSVDTRDAQRASWVVVLDNLLKGAATQALQNLNLALRFDERCGILKHSETAS